MRAQLRSLETSVHDRLIDIHLDYLANVDHNFRTWWTRLSADSRNDKRVRLYELNRTALSLSAEGDGSEYYGAIKQRVDTLLRVRLSELPDTSFRLEPEVTRFVASAFTRSQNQKVYLETSLRIAKALHEGSHLVAVYGGLKSAEIVRQKVSAFRVGQQGLDLWDLIRIRVVVKTLSEIPTVANTLRKDYEEDVIRFRNYYVHPRHDQDLYRAVHMTVKDRERFVEIQIMTELREVVCEIDHAIAFKRSLAPFCMSHLSWLKLFPLAANLLDAGLRLPQQTVVVSQQRCGVLSTVQK